MDGKTPDGFLDNVTWNFEENQQRVNVDRDTEIESIHLYGDRAVVTCIVTMPQKPPNKYHNVRLFIRETAGWKLLGWANEAIP